MPGHISLFIFSQNYAGISNDKIGKVQEGFLSVLQLCFITIVVYFNIALLLNLESTRVTAQKNRDDIATKPPIKHVKTR